MTLVQVQNYGIGGLSVQDYLQMYRNYARLHHPRYVVIAFTVSNDILDASPFLHTRHDLKSGYLYNAQGQIVDVAPYTDPHNGIVNDTKLWLRSHVATYRFVSLIRQIKTYQDPYGINRLFFLYEDPPQPEYATAWQYASWALSTLVDEVRVDGASPIIIVIPPWETVSNSAWTRNNTLYGKHYANTLDRDKISADFRALAADLDVPLLDLYPTMHAAKLAGQEPYNEGNGHFSPHGHQIVADLLYEQISAMIAADRAAGS